MTVPIYFNCGALNVVNMGAFILRAVVMFVNNGILNVVNDAITGLNAPVTFSREGAEKEVNDAIVGENPAFICCIPPRFNVKRLDSAFPSSNVAAVIFWVNPALFIIDELYKLN
jgi:hypothetical protein